MAFCTNCGASIESTTKFCPNCGTCVVQSDPVSYVPEQRDIPVEEPVSAPVQGSYQPIQENPAEESQPQQGCYVPSAEQDNTPPVQPQSYTPPVQQSYTSSTEPQSYTPPAPQSYTPPTAQPKQPKQPKQPGQKAPLNKKMLFIISGAVLAVILAVVLIVALGGKGDKPASNDDPNLGIYNAMTAEMWGTEIEISDLWEKGFSIELKDNGKCSIEVDGKGSSGKWSLEDGAFNVNGGGMDCNGTLANGVMVLENVLDMGITLTFEKEGSYTGTNTGTEDSNPVSGTTDLQRQWNGTWYGCLYVSEATGDFSGISCDDYDVYMVVDVDGEGKGTFAVYLDGVDEAFALANCEARESGLYAVDGTIAGGVDMYAYNWMFLPMPDYPDQYVMSDDIEDGGSQFSFSLFMKQWGGSWQKELDSNFAIVPPSVDAYNAAIENNELPPVGFAPAGY